MTLFMAAMAVNAAEESAEMESGAAAVANVTEAVKETAENATAKAGEVKEEAAEKAAPGFESLFALTGLVGAALLLARRA
jgi:PGF-CTERM protein